ncbi:MAG: ABC-F family ATP-binding cassette domain-containing protein [Candidatus Latescibacterota bacterium]|nr:MAG: ABC-F family ATP-binding cassette domain-containing protein [Candidatus Latescibacterota bacterium]
MHSAGIDFDDVFFAYDAMSTSLIEGLTCRFPVGWTGIIGANGVGKTTLLRLATGILAPDGGEVRIPGIAIYCEQRTDDVPRLFAELVATEDQDAVLIKATLGIQPDWVSRWDTLSHGERKRAQIGVMLWRRPDVLAVDEPTNHLDMEARELLAKALASYRGIGLLVSHDRELLDTLCGHCLFVDPPEILMRRGGYTKAYTQLQREEESARRRHELARATRKKLEREASRRRAAASQSDLRRSRRFLARGDHDGREKIDRARVSGKDAVAGKLLRQIQGRLKQAREKETGAEVKKTYDTGIWLPSARSRRDVLFSIDDGSIELGAGRSLRHPALVMRPDDRIALTGPNGAGKSTLVRHIVDSLDMPEERLTYVPQEIDRTSSITILKRARELPRKKLGVMMTAVSRLGSRPQRLLESVEPSPGETRKLLLALGIAHEPHLIIMDEPTNHMDLPSIQCLEDALDGCPCGLLLVSHDRHFLKRLTNRRWDVLRFGQSADDLELREKRWE